MSKLSLLASYNGGAVVKSAGKMKYERSGNAFTVTSFGQTQIHTALIQYHTNNELMFQYLLAYLGWAAFHAQMAQAKKSFCIVTELNRNYETNAYREDRH